MFETHHLLELLLSLLEANSTFYLILYSTLQIDILLQYAGLSHSLLHYWYTAWPDHKPPDSPHMLLTLIQEVELRRCSSVDLKPQGPVCVHCRSVKLLDLNINLKCQIICAAYIPHRRQRLFLTLNTAKLLNYYY